MHQTHEKNEKPPLPNPADRGEMPVLVATFYRFAPLEDLVTWRAAIQEQMHKADVVGTILLASEGINGTICGSPQGVEELLGFLRRIPGFERLPHQESRHPARIFAQAKVKIKPEIVTLGFPAINPAERTGKHVSPEEWNQLLADPSVLLVDTRNAYEVRVGTFEGAIDPKIRTFRDFPRYLRETISPQKHPKIAIFCTGGIRCEKASAWMLQEGFEEVYQLQGGILAYLREIPPDQSLWKGACFVFDDRIGLQPSLEAAPLSLCSRCGEPLTPSEVQQKAASPDALCPYCPPLTQISGTPSPHPCKGFGTP